MPLCGGVKQNILKEKLNIYCIINLLKFWLLPRAVEQLDLMDMGKIQHFEIKNTVFTPFLFHSILI